MSRIRASCSCGKVYQVDRKLAGRKLKCKACGKAFFTPKVKKRPTTDSDSPQGDDDFLGALDAAVEDAESREPPLEAAAPRVKGKKRKHGNKGTPCWFCRKSEPNRVTKDDSCDVELSFCRSDDPSYDHRELFRLPRCTSCTVLHSIGGCLIGCVTGLAGLLFIPVMIWRFKYLFVDTEAEDRENAFSGIWLPLIVVWGGCIMLGGFFKLLFFLGVLGTHPVKDRSLEYAKIKATLAELGSQGMVLNDERSTFG